MKSTTLKQIAIILGFLPALALGQYSTAQAVSFALTETSLAPGLLARDTRGVPLPDANGKSFMRYENDFTVNRGAVSTTTSEWSSKMVPSRITNKEILTALKDAEVITTIVGYSIWLLKEDRPLSEDGRVNVEPRATFHLVKIGLAPIDISAYMDLSKSPFHEVANELEKKVSTVVSPSNQAGLVVTRTISSKGGVTINFNQDDDNRFSASGLYTRNGANRLLQRGTQVRTIFVPAAETISNIYGEYIRYNGEERLSLLEGRISMGAATTL